MTDAAVIGHSCSISLAMVDLPVAFVRQLFIAHSRSIVISSILSTVKHN